MTTAPETGSRRRTAFRPEVVDLDGQWGFIPQDIPLADVRQADREPISVPGLWEAQGWLDLDGPAWYVRDVELADATGYWTLTFGAVMDEAEVYVNGAFVGRHTGPYTPFSFDVTDVLGAGPNEIAVRVHDHVVGSPSHLRSAHGKQGWKNDVFPSPPSLYITYGGIWQPVTLARHAAVTVDDAFVNGDPAAPAARIRVRNRGVAAAATLELEIDGRVLRRDLILGEAGEHEVVMRPELADLAYWSPQRPVLHWARVRVRVGDEVQHERAVRFGVRTVTVDGDRLTLNGEPLRMQAALVQGFRGDKLYAEGTREEIEEEVLAAKALGLNTLRLHIKAFDPVYLDVCDEVGMLLHCDLPIAEPIAETELDDTGPLADACAAAAAEQVIRDRNHPSIVLWSAMNEIGAEDPSLGVRAGGGYQRFVHRLYQLLTDLDGTRPIIENDYVEAGSEHVYRSRILTAHWYGRLSRQYLADVHSKIGRSVDGGRVLLVSEFGDWALPTLSPAPASAPARAVPFWRPARLRDEVARLPWPGTVDEFVRGTQRYKGIADSLQIELFRRAPGIAGWCVTQLTDVPHEYNGLWELDRTAKDGALPQIAAACRPTLPMVVPVAGGAAGSPYAVGAWNGWAGEDMRLSFVASHDGPERLHGTVTVAVVTEDGRRSATMPLRVALEPYGPTPPRPVTVRLPVETGRQELSVALVPDGRAELASTYAVHAFRRPTPRHRVFVIGDDRDTAAVAAAGGIDGADGPLVIGEGAMRGDVSETVESALRAGRNVLVLAQTSESARHLPVAAVAIDLATEWGSLPYFFSTQERRLSAVPVRTVVTTELLSVTPSVVYTALGADPWPATLVLGMYKPDPRRASGSVVGAIPLHRGHLWFCQLPLVDAACVDDPTAVATLSDLLDAVAYVGE
jgi:hypothetical protein